MKVSKDLSGYVAHGHLWRSLYLATILAADGRFLLLMHLVKTLASNFWQMFTV